MVLKCVSFICSVIQEMVDHCCKDDVDVGSDELNHSARQMGG